MKLIPKYQNEGLVTRQDNTYVAKPTIPPKLIKRTYTPTQSYVSQDNRSEWQREQGSKKADEEYKKYVEDKKMQQGLENLNGFLNFADAATIATGVGSVVGKGLRWGGKKVANQLVKRKINGRASDYLSRARIGDILRESDYITPDNKSYKLPDYATPNSPKEPLDLHSDRLIKGGFDNIPATVNGKTKFRVGRNAWDYRSPSQFYNVHYYDREPQQYLDNMVQDMHVVNDENPADLLYKVANYAKDTDAQATASSGNIYIGKDGMFKIFNEYGGNPKNIRRVISHEVDHAIHIPAEPPRGFDTGYIDKHISQPGYFSNKNGTELAARGSQLKDYYGLDDPNQEITEDMLRYAAENYVKDTKLDNNMGLFFKSITDWKEAAKWLSKYATIAGVPITINNKTK
jgi:hypothetical protein